MDSLYTHSHTTAQATAIAAPFKAEWQGVWGRTRRRYCQTDYEIGGGGGRAGCEVWKERKPGGEGGWGVEREKTGAPEGGGWVSRGWWKEVLPGAGHLLGVKGS